MLAHTAGPTCAQAALGGPLALLMIPQGEQALCLQLDQFLVLLAKMQVEGLIPLLSPRPRHEPLCPLVAHDGTVALTLLVHEDGSSPKRCH